MKCREHAPPYLLRARTLLTTGEWSKAPRTHLYLAPAVSNPSMQRPRPHSPNTGQILRTPSSDKDDSVLLERVSLTHDVRLDGVAVRQLDTGNLTLG